MGALESRGDCYRLIGGKSEHVITNLEGTNDKGDSPTLIQQSRCYDFSRISKKASLHPGLAWGSQVASQKNVYM